MCFLCNIMLLLTIDMCCFPLPPIYYLPLFVLFNCQNDDYFSHCQKKFLNLYLLFRVCQVFLGAQVVLGVLGVTVDNIDEDLLAPEVQVVRVVLYHPFHPECHLVHDVLVFPYPLSFQVLLYVQAFPYPQVYQAVLVGHRVRQVQEDHHRHLRQVVQGYQACQQAQGVRQVHRSHFCHAFLYAQGLLLNK